MKENVKVCVSCGNDSFVKGFQVQQGSMMKKKIGFVGCTIEHLICTNCGLIIESRVSNPNMFRLNNTEKGNE